MRSLEAAGVGNAMKNAGSIILLRLGFLEKFA